MAFARPNLSILDSSQSIYREFFIPCHSLAAELFVPGALNSSTYGYIDISRAEILVELDLSFVTLPVFSVESKLVVDRCLY